MKAEWTNSDSLTTSQTTKAILVIDVPNEHLWKTLNDIYERMKGYKCSFKQMPQKYCTDGDDIEEDSYYQGWNECIDAIVGETE